jgi:hypothetical protein
MTIRGAATITLLFFAATALPAATRQKPTHPGNQPGARPPAVASITATFDGVVLDSEQHMVFFYVFHNSSAQDYEIPGGVSTRLFALLAARKNGTRELSDQEMRVRYPIVIHPHQVQIVPLHDMAHTYVVSVHLKQHPTKAEYDKYEIAVKAAVRKAWPELNGFRVEDTRTGQSISLPRPFKEIAGGRGLGPTPWTGAAGSSCIF